MFTLVVVGIYFKSTNDDEDADVSDIHSPPPPPPRERVTPLASWEFLAAVPIVTLGYACHTMVFPVYREYMHRSLKEGVSTNTASRRFEVRSK
jgi:amino acid permease